VKLSEGEVVLLRMLVREDLSCNLWKLEQKQINLRQELFKKLLRIEP
jgi:hypothetical protein